MILLPTAGRECRSYQDYACRFAMRECLWHGRSRL